MVKCVTRSQCGVELAPRARVLYRGGMPLNLTAEQRIQKAVTVSPSGCWLWGKHINADGYGKIRFEKIAYLAHRLSYQVHIGPIPDGMQLDHLCRVRSCVNPAHLEPVTCAENLHRGEHSNMKAYREDVCPLGHVLSGDNLSPRTDGRRKCKTCVNARARQRRARLARQGE